MLASVPQVGVISKQDAVTSKEGSRKAEGSCIPSPTPNSLAKRFPCMSLPLLSGTGKRSLGIPTIPTGPPTTPLRRLQIDSPDRKVRMGRIYRDQGRHLLVTSMLQACTFELLP